jgi:hypothetical protein
VNTFRFTRREVVGTGVASAAIITTPLRAAVAPDDMAILRRAYLLLHPGLLRYNSPRAVEEHFATLDRDWRATDDLAKRYLALSRFLGTVRCGHSYANFYNQSDAVAAQLFGGRNRLPFSFCWVGDAMIVLAEPSGALPKGTLVETIDGRPVAQILKALLPLVRADGSNNAKRRQLLGVRGTDGYETFDIYYPLVFPVSDQFAITARRPDGRPLAIKLTPIDLFERRRSRPAAASGGTDTAQWTMEHRAKTAIMTMNTWGLYNSKWNWQAWLDAAFADLQSRDTQKLVIDIRRNEGGLDCGNAVIARLIDTPLRLDSYVQRVRYRRIPDDMVPYLDTWDPSFKDWGENVVPFDARFFDLKRDSQDTVIAPQGPRFRGEVVVLIGPENSSATFQFANLVQQNRLAKLMGEPTGGNLRGINGGAFFFLRLPQSGLEVDLPLIGTFALTAVRDSGLIPDKTVPVTAHDITTGTDSALEAAIRV